MGRCGGAARIGDARLVGDDPPPSLDSGLSQHPHDRLAVPRPGGRRLRAGRGGAAHPSPPRRRGRCRLPRLHRDRPRVERRVGPLRLPGQLRLAVRHAEPGCGAGRCGGAGACRRRDLAVRSPTWRTRFQSSPRCSRERWATKRSLNRPGTRFRRSRSEYGGTAARSSSRRVAVRWWRGLAGPGGGCRAGFVGIETQPSRNL